MQNKSPILAIDARLYQNRSGAWRIATATVDRFVADYADEFEKIVLIAHSKKVFDLLPDGKNVKKVRIPGHFLFWKLLLVPFALFANRADVYFSPTSELPLWKLWKTKYVNMVHDLFMEEILDGRQWTFRGLFASIKYFLQHRDLFESFYVAGLFGKGFAMADSTVAISHFSKNQAVERYRLNPDKVPVAYIAADDRFFEEYAVDDAFRQKLAERFGIRWKYVFTYDAVGDFEKFSKAVSEVCNNHWLIWVVLNRHDSVYAAFLRSGAWDNVVFIREFVTDDELVNLVRGSEFVFFPSPGEGFWIPIAESLAAGKTLLVPNITAMPEVWWPCVTCYDPRDISDLIGRLESVFERNLHPMDPNAAFFASKYRWETFSKLLLSLLRAELN